MAAGFLNHQQYHHTALLLDLLGEVGIDCRAVSDEDHEMDEFCVEPEPPCLVSLVKICDPGHFQIKCSQNLNQIQIHDL